MNPWLRLLLIISIVIVMSRIFELSKEQMVGQFVLGLAMVAPYFYRFYSRDIDKNHEDEEG